MFSERLRSLWPLVHRDLLVLASTRESFDGLLDGFVRRRAGYYLAPAPPFDDAWWANFASALAPLGPPEWMPLCSLIEEGNTLAGGARGFRGLFTSAPSDKERKKVLKIASLAARVVEIVAGADKRLTPEELRSRAMLMASFGLGAEELAQLEPPRPLSFESLEIYGDLDRATRRSLLRGAWQLAINDLSRPDVDLAVRGVANKLDLGAECDLLRSAVVEHQGRQAETAQVAVELARVAARWLTLEQARPWLELLVSVASPAPRREELLAHALSGAPPRFDALPRLDAGRRRQAIVMALSAVLGHHPDAVGAVALRGELTAVAYTAGAGSELAETLQLVDRYLFDRVREAVAALTAPAPNPEPAPTPSGT